MRNVHLAVLGLVLPVGLACNQGGGDVHWGSLGNDPTGNYNNRRETKLNVSNVGGLKVAWTSRQFGNVNGAAAAVGNTLYVQSNTGTYAINATTGEVQGERPWSWVKIVLFILMIVGIIGVIALIGAAVGK